LQELASDLAVAKKAQLQLQREFDAFKDITAQVRLTTQLWMQMGVLRTAGDEPDMVCCANVLR
jgi:hypothetical protein